MRWKNRFFVISVVSLSTFALVASGKGVYLGYGVPLTNPTPASGVAVVPVSDPDATIEVCVVSRREASPVVSQFLECVGRVFPPDALAQVGVRAQRAS